MENADVCTTITGRLGANSKANGGLHACSLDFKVRKRSVMTPGHYTELFFLDESDESTGASRCRARPSGSTAPLHIFFDLPSSG